MHLSLIRLTQVLLHANPFSFSPPRSQKFIQDGYHQLNAVYRQAITVCARKTDVWQCQKRPVMFVLFSRTWSSSSGLLNRCVSFYILVSKLLFLLLFFPPFFLPQFSTLILRAHIPRQCWPCRNNCLSVCVYRSQLRQD